MSSLLKASTTGKPLFIWLVDFLLILLSLSSSSVHGASLREHRLRGSEPDPQRENLQQAPSADMLKALEYIESLRQRTGTDTQKQTGYHTANLDDTQKQRDMLRLAPNPNPMQSKGQVEPDEEEEEEQEVREADKTEELLQAVLSALQQTEKASKPASLRSSGMHLSAGEAERAGIKEDTYPWEQQKQRGIMLHKKMPLLFEDEEEGEGDEEEDEEGPDLEHGSPLKRTNENVEEKYTPQNLATLESVFEELGKLTDTKATHKRQDEEDDTEEDDEVDDDDDIFDVRNVVYDDEAGDLADWAPQEELEDEEAEEEEGNNQEAERGLDRVNDEEDEDDDNDALEEEDESYLVKRSSNSGPQRDPEDIANLVDYYFLKVLEKTEEERKRELEEEKQRAERRAAQYSDKIDPRAIYQLIQISQQFQIPPEDLLDMLRTGEMTNQGQALQKNNELTRVGNKLSRVSSKKTHESPAQVYNKPERQNSNTPENLRTEEILKILGLGGLENPDQAPLRRQRQYKSSQSRIHTQPGEPARDFAPTQRLLTSKLKDDYDDTVDEDELAAYLAAQMLAQYPEHTYKNKAGQKRETVDRATPGSFEQAIQDYFDQMDSDTYQKRQSDSDDQSGGLENEAVMKLLSYMNPETQESDDDDAKSVPGM